MSSKIFLIQADASLVAMVEGQYDSEDLLQELLSRYPDLLAGDQINSVEPRRWLLITREMGIPGEETGGNRWSIDHLFVDQDAVPTLIEVKRSSDTRIRREVVGQMLDYAANAISYWPTDALQARFKTKCELAGTDPEAVFAETFGPDVIRDTFWERVSVNVKAGRLRLVFVADVIPPELRRVIDFLNANMPSIDVIGIEVKQFTGQGLRALVPHVVTQTSVLETPISTSSARIQWNEKLFREALSARTHGAQAVTVFEAILRWAESRPVAVEWNRAVTQGAFIIVIECAGVRQKPITVWNYGRVSIDCGDVLRFAPFNDETLRRALMQRLNAISGVNIPEAKIDKYPSIELHTLAPPEATYQFLEVLDWVVRQIREEADDMPRVGDDTSAGMH